jgi:hypothetical protein
MPGRGDDDDRANLGSADAHSAGAENQAAAAGFHRIEQGIDYPAPSILARATSARWSPPGGFSNGSSLLHSASVKLLGYMTLRQGSSCAATITSWIHPSASRRVRRLTENCLHPVRAMLRLPNLEPKPNRCHPAA